MTHRAALLLLAVGPSACGLLGLSTAPATLSTLENAVDDVNDELEDGTWRVLDRVSVLGRDFEAYQFGEAGPRFVRVPTAGAAVGVQTWVGGPGTYAAGRDRVSVAATVIRRTAERNRAGIAVRTGFDSQHLNVRTLAAPNRWTTHLNVHSALLCKTPWRTNDVERAVARHRPSAGWTAVAERLTRTSWRIRSGGPDVASTTASAAEVQSALAAWFRPARAVVVVSGPVEREAFLLQAARAYARCHKTPTRVARMPPPQGQGTLQTTEVPGDHRHVLISWVLPRLTPTAAAATDGLALMLSDPRNSPLGRAIVPEHAVGVVLRHRRHAQGTDFELLMTLAPSAAAPTAVGAARTVLERLADMRDDRLDRARQTLRNRTLRRLSELDGAGAAVAQALLNGETLDVWARRLEASVALSGSQVRRLVANYLVNQPPLIVVGQPTDGT